MEAGNQPRSFSFETGLVSAPWLLAMNGQDPEMRAKAVSVLMTWPRREGVWDGQKVADVVERTHELTESNRLGRQQGGAKALEPSSLAADTGDFHACLFKNPWRSAPQGHAGW